MAKVKYIGESFGVTGLTNGKVYECWVDAEDCGLLRVIDNSGEDYLYSAVNPQPLDGSSPGGVFEIIDDEDGAVKALMQSQGATAADMDFKKFYTQVFSQETTI